MLMIMRNEFKVGNRVRIINNSEDAPYNVGDVGTICRYNYIMDSYLIAFDILNGKKRDPSHSQSQWYVIQERLGLEKQLIRCE